MTSSKAALEWKGRTDSACVASNIDCWSLTDHHNSVLLWYVSEEGIWKKTHCTSAATISAVDCNLRIDLLPSCAYTLLLLCSRVNAISHVDVSGYSFPCEEGVLYKPLSINHCNKQMQTNLLLLYSTVSP